MIKSLLRKTIVYTFWREYVQLREYVRWKKNGLPLPPPHVFKQGIVKDYAKTHQCRIFFETGTYKGDMIWAVKDNFQIIYSIELDQSFYLRALQRFCKEKHVTLLQGDSAKLLPSLLKRVSDPCLFWLDAHYSGANTARGESMTPILEETKAILSHHVQNHVILIDDAREFTGRGDYPSLEELKKVVLGIRPELMMLVELDIIRIFNPS